MEKPTDVASYRLGDEQIEPMPYFLYDISIYILTENMAQILTSKYYKTTKLIKNNTKYKKIGDKVVIRFINLIGAPMEFIQDKHLSIYQLNQKRK